jgi:hypothetical protein
MLRAPDHGILIIVSPAPPDKSVLPAANALASILRNDGLQARVSTAFVGTKALAGNHLIIMIYAK